MKSELSESGTHEERGMTVWADSSVFDIQDDAVRARKAPHTHYSRVCKNDTIIKVQKAIELNRFDAAGKTRGNPHRLCCPDRL